MNKLAIIILAAGKGTRMNSDLPKVVHKIGNQPMINHVINTSEKLNPNKIITVLGYKQDVVKSYLLDYNLEFAYQNKQLGTGHAIMQCTELLIDFFGMKKKNINDIKKSRSKNIIFSWRKSIFKI